MVQVQSAWFPLYDRNPQTFVPNIFWAKPEDFKKATQRIYHSSYIELPMARDHDVRIVGYPSSTFWRTCESVPSPEFEKVGDGWAVTQDLCPFCSAAPN